jgi:uncharacterized protein YhfF
MTDVPPPDHFPEAICEFGIPGSMRDSLVRAVLRGDKTATSSLSVEWEHEGEAMPVIGDRATVIDSAGDRLAVIEWTAIELIRLGDVGSDVALAEGEGFAGVSDWRQAHERFWNEHSLPELPDEVLSSLTDDTVVVVEHFRVVSSARR